MTSADYGWLFRDSPSLVLVMDERLVCQGIATLWRDRLEPRLSDESEIPASELFDFDVAPDLVDQFKAVARDGTTIVNTAVGLRLAEGILPCRFGAWRARQHEDEQPCIVVAATDVSKYRDAMEELTELQKEHRLILDSAGEGIYGLDCEGHITFGNAAAFDIVGWHTEDVLGQRAHDVHHHSHADGSNYPRDECPIYAALKDGEVHNVDTEVFWHANGSPVPVEYTSTPIRKDGELDGAVVVFRDISERRELERQREAAYSEIKALTEQLEQERDYLRDEVKVTVNYGEIIGESLALKRTLAKVEAVAKTTANVLILGESGVGKEMIARAIHYNSQRADKPLIKVNCASIPKELFESEFFGHVRGAFTGAHKDRIGRLQLANGGSLFLDEIGEIPMSLQGKLLRALQEQEFERIGDDVTTKVDVRIVAATNRNLEKEVAAGRFREDLFYRLSVFPMELAPLRERIEDIAGLATHFLGKICRDFGRDPLQLTKQHIAMLQSHQWPGNVRELRNVIERAVILTTGTRLRVDLAMGAVAVPESQSEPVESAAAHYLTEEEFRETEKQNLISVLRAAQWRVWGPDGAAAMLGIKPSTLSYRVNAFGIEKGQS